MVSPQEHGSRESPFQIEQQVDGLRGGIAPVDVVPEEHQPVGLREAQRIHETPELRQTAVDVTDTEEATLAHSSSPSPVAPRRRASARGSANVASAAE